MVALTPPDGGCCCFGEDKDVIIGGGLERVCADCGAFGTADTDEPVGNCHTTSSMSGKKNVTHTSEESGGMVEEEGERDIADDDDKSPLVWLRLLLSLCPMAVSGEVGDTIDKAESEFIIAFGLELLLPKLLLLIEIQRSIGSRRSTDTPTFCTKGCAVAVMLVFEIDMRMIKTDDDDVDVVVDDDEGSCVGAINFIPVEINPSSIKGAAVVCMEDDGKFACEILESPVVGSASRCREERSVGPSIPPPLPPLPPPLLATDWSPSNPKDSESPDVDPPLPL